MIKKYWQTLKNSFKRFVKGKENFWITLLGWGIGFYGLCVIIIQHIAQFSLSIYFYKYLGNSGMIAVLVKIGIILVCTIIQIFGIIWLFLAFIYPFIFIFSLIRSSLRDTVVYVIFAVMVAIIFIIFHILLFFMSIKAMFLIGAINAPVIFIFYKIQSFFL
jgi:hypothetical protein